MADDQRWKKRIFRVGPLIGLLALLPAISCVICAWYILKLINGRSIDYWPNVNSYLSATSAVAATLIRFSIGGGLAIHWWRRAMNVRSVAYLHRQWKVGTGILGVLKTPRGFGLVSVAIIARTLLVVVPPVLQLAVDRTQNPPVELSVTLPEHLPQDWAGGFDPRSNEYWPSKFFQVAYRDHSLPIPVETALKGCEGECQLIISTPGLAFEDKDCGSEVQWFNGSDSLTDWPRTQDGHRHLLFEAGYSTIFREEAEWFGPSNMKHTEPLPEPPQDQQTVAIFFTVARVIDGLALVEYRQCWLRSAIISHNVTVNHFGEVLNETNTTPVEINNDATFGESYRERRNSSASIATVLRAMAIDLNSSVSFDEEGMYIDDRGSLGASTIIISDSPRDFDVIADPMGVVMDKLNSVYFRAAATYGLVYNDSVFPEELQLEPMAKRQIIGHRTDLAGTVYRTRMIYYIVPACIQGSKILFASILYWGWWQLGRRVSFSPIEIAKAFDAPLLRDANTNAGAKGFVQDIGNLHIRYGAVKQEQAPVAEDSKYEADGSVSDGPSARLLFGVPDKTLRPYNGQLFSK